MQQRLHLILSNVFVLLLFTCFLLTLTEVITVNCDALVCLYVCADICAGVLWARGWCQTIEGLSTMAVFGDIGGYFFGSVRDKIRFWPALLDAEHLTFKNNYVKSNK